MKKLNDLDYRVVLGLRTENPTTEDPTYSSLWENIYNVPLFISYPRTGAHWINAVMELYFDRPRAPARRATFLDPERQDFAWFHDHDTIAFDELYLEDEKTAFGSLYLYRDPVSVVYSWIIYNFNYGKSLKILQKDRLRELVVAVSEQYRDHLTKWLIDTPAKHHVRYENFKKDPLLEFRKVQAYLLDQSLENVIKYTTPDLIERLKACFDLVTPVELSKRRTEPRTLSDFMLTDEYKEDRVTFLKTYEEIINSIVITEDLKEFFE